MQMRMRESMEKLPLVSIIIISYNQKAYIRDCMEGLLAQNYQNMEILYLDDCSPDHTYEEASLYESRLKKKYGNNQVRFIQNQENKGLIKNLNRLVEESKGSYVKFMSADDFMLEGAIDRLVACMEAHPEYDLLYTNGIYGDDHVHFPAEDIRLVNTAPGVKKLYDKPQASGKDLFEQLYKKDFIAAPTVMVRREVYERCGMYDERIGVEDWDFYLRIAEQGCIGYLDEATVMYRFTDESLSHSNHPLRRVNMQKSTLLIREKYKDKVQRSQELIEESLNDAFQDAVHIGNQEYFVFLREYAERNSVRISGKNRARYLLYRLYAFKILEFFRGCLR